MAADEIGGLDEEEKLGRREREFDEEAQLFQPSLSKGKPAGVSS